MPISPWRSSRGGLNAALAACLCFSCAVGPDFQSPRAPQVSTIPAQPLPAETEASPGNGGEPQVFVAASVAPADWWKLYGSEQLNRLVDLALRASPTIAAAQAGLREAQQNLIAQRGALMPSLSVGAGVTRQEVNGASQGLPQLGSFLYNLYNTSISLAYNPDVFGGVRRAVEGGAAAQEARRNEIEAASQELAANVVSTAVLEASLRAQSDATDQLIASARRQLDLTRQQFELGSVPRSALATAKTNLALFEANLPPLRQQIALARSQLAVYLGQTPAEYDNAPLDLVALRLPREIPLMLPADLVRRRPDIREAEAQLHQASANIGVATANLLPQVNISGNVGYSSLAFGKLLDGRGFSVGTNLTQPIFQGGTLMARRRAAIAAYEQAMAQYQQTVLLAFKGVADSLRALDNDAQSLAAQHRAQSAATESLELIEQRFRYGSASDLELLTAQQQFQRARIGYVQALASRYTDTAALFLALGGDWGSSTDSCP